MVRCDSRGGIVAWVNGTEHRLADAQLIAAAPDLLEAAEETEEVLRQIRPSTANELIKLRAAIAKAKGKASD